jgi:glutamyl-Q tRNA(Asp) synthetase
VHVVASLFWDIKESARIVRPLILHVLSPTRMCGFRVAPMTTPIFRFAPSPNGYLHLGHALSAILNFDMAQRSGGRFLLLIEDIDKARCRLEYEAAIYEDLAWLGICWEDPVRRQSSHLDAYEAALRRLDAMALIYPSFESRAEIARLVADRDGAGPWPRDPDGVPLYPGRAKNLPMAERRRRRDAGDPFALRLDMAAAMALASPHDARLTWSETAVGPEGETGAGPNRETLTIVADPAAWGDVILARKDVPTSYHLSVVVDDAHQGITHVVRGRDLFHATSLHRLLQHLLRLPQPAYHHHRLICDAEGRKLSKATHATGLRELRASGATPADIRQTIGLP